MNGSLGSKKRKKGRKGEKIARGRADWMMDGGGDLGKKHNINIQHIHIHIHKKRARGRKPKPKKE